jgi:hypothetical protein
MPGPAELREWLEEEANRLRQLADGLRGDPEKLYMCGYSRGRQMEAQKVLDYLESLDSSHDLPSTKG